MHQLHVELQMDDKQLDQMQNVELFVKTTMEVTQIVLLIVTHVMQINLHGGHMHFHCVTTQLILRRIIRTR